MCKLNFWKLQHLLALMMFVLALPVSAQDSYYTRVDPPQPTDQPAKIEVIEFFAFSCPHCSNLYAPLAAWVKKLPPDVVFKRIPVTFNRAAMASNARLFYALEAIGQLDRLEEEIFRAHEQRLNLYDEDTLIKWIATKGVDPQKFKEAFKSFGADSQAKRADRLAQNYNIPGVPTIVVDGKYRLETREPAELLANTDRVIAKVRAERGNK